MLFIKALRDSLYRHQETIINTLVAEQGKVYEEAQFEYLAVLEMVDFYIRAGAEILRPKAIPVRLLPHRRFVIERRPFGVTLVISPWNYPLFLSLGPITSALLAGNSVIYKPSEYATQIGEVIAAVVRAADVPPEVFQIVHGFGRTGARLIEAGPDRIVFTGSVPTGKKIAEQAAKQLIPVTLELGGNDAAIVLDDADIARAAEGIVWSGMFNAGQTCASVERVVVVRQAAKPLIDALKRTIEQHLFDGNGAPKRTLAALTTPTQLDIVQAQVQDALNDGARALIGGHPLPEMGWQFFAPTLLVDVTPEMRICREETFGPVIAVMVVEDEQEAIRLNNETIFGLTASVWTRDRARGERVARRLEVGHVSVNSHLVVSGVSEIPWGGVKQSGYGRTHGEEGLLEMTYSQTVDAGRIDLPFEPFAYPYNMFKRGLVQRAIDVLYGPGLREKLKAISF